MLRLRLGTAMRFAWIVNLVLIAAVAGLAAYAWQQGRHPEEPTHKLSTLAAATATRIEVAFAEGAGYALEKRNGTWFLTAPITARADQTQVQRLLDLLSASSKDKLAATDLERFELTSPRLKVTIDGQAFAFGTTNPLTQDQYLATGDGVYLVSTYYASLIPTRAERMLTHRLFDDNERPVSFAFGGMLVEQKDGKWSMTPEPADESEKPSQDDLNRWADDWRYASSLLTQGWDGEPGSDTVEVKLADGKDIALAVVRKAPELVLARPDEKLQFQFSGEMSRRLLQPGAPEPPPAANAKPAQKPK
jgi:Domain of unknown function (DUF4340)